MTMSAAPMASGAITPAPAPMPVHPMVKTRKNVPINSAMYLFIMLGSRPLNNGYWITQRDLARHARAGRGQFGFQKDLGTGSSTGLRTAPPLAFSQRWQP